MNTPNSSVPNSSVSNLSETEPMAIDAFMQRSDTGLTSHQMKCLEVWGGNEPVETRLEVPGIDAYLFSQPYDGAAMGGDIHYVSSCFCGHIARFVVADVAGHGEHVSELSSTLRDMVRKRLNSLDQRKLARDLNTEFGNLSASSGRFATAIMASYLTDTHQLLICNAGHPRPLMYQAATKRWLYLDEEGEAAVDQSQAPHNLPLGVIEPTGYHQFAVQLEPHDLVFTYSDAITETVNPKTGEMLGEAGLLALAEEAQAIVMEQADGMLDPGLFGQTIHKCLDHYRGTSEAEDDLTMLVLHHNGSIPMVNMVQAASNMVKHLVGLGPK